MSTFSHKFFIFKTCRLFFIAIIIQTIAAGSATSISEKTKTEILSQFDTTENAIQSFLNMFTNEDDAGHELVENSEESDQTAASPENKSNERLFYTRLAPSSAKKAQCRVLLFGLDKFVGLSDLEDEINNILSKLVEKKNPKELICDVSWSYMLKGPDYKNCKELAELIQCGVGHVKNGFSKADKILEWRNAYQNMSGFIQRALDDTIQSYHYEQKIKTVKNEIQNLANAFNRIKVKKDEEKKGKTDDGASNCVSKKLSKFCPVDSWFYFQNDVTRFLKVCDFVPELMSNVRNGKISDALESFKKLKEPDWKNFAIFEEVVGILYKEEGKDNLENILSFITSVPWYGHRVYFITKLVEEMKDHNDVSCSRLTKVVASIEPIVQGYTHSRVYGEKRAYDEERTIKSTKRLAKELYDENCNTSDE